MQHTSFQISDLMEPTKMLCKVDTVPKAMKGDIAVHDDPSLVRRESFKIISPTIIIFLGTRPYIRRGFDAEWRI